MSGMRSINTQLNPEYVCSLIPEKSNERKQQKNHELSNKYSITFKLRNRKKQSSPYHFPSVYWIR